MADGENGSLRASDERLEAAGKARGDACPGLAAARATGAGLVRPRPGAVVGERATLERAEADLVEERLDQAGRPAAGERESERVLRPPQARADAEVDLLRGESAAECASFLDARCGEALAGGNAVDGVSGVRGGVRMARQDQGDHRSTER